MRYTVAAQPTTAIKTARAQVTQQKAPITIVCAGAAGTTCRGTLTVSTQVRGRVDNHTRMVTVTLARTSYIVRAGRQVTVTMRINATGLTLLKRASNHRLSEQVMATAPSGRRTRRTITLVLAPATKHR